MRDNFKRNKKMIEEAKKKKKLEKMNKRLNEKAASASPDTAAQPQQQS